MAKIEVHHKSELIGTTYTSKDRTTVPDHEGLTLIFNSEHDILRLQLTWLEYGAIWQRVVKYLIEHDPDHKLLTM